MKNLNAKIYSSYPTELEVIKASATASVGRWSAIQVIVADFPNNITHFEQNGVGKDLSDLNAVIEEGSGLMLFGNWNKLHLPLGSDGIIIAYKFD